MKMHIRIDKKKRKRKKHRVWRATSNKDDKSQIVEFDPRLLKTKSSAEDIVD